MQKKVFLLLFLATTLLACTKPSKGKFDSLKKLPTIQEAWVDKGYFKWVDHSKTSLRITGLGAQQEYLPDVCDGEQLVLGLSMFSPAHSNQKSILKKAPMFNSSNITEFCYMFSFCDSLTSIPLLDTSKGETFTGMFYSCESLTTIPLLDTSMGWDFSEMFKECESLISIPELNTSKGKNFNYMFYGCISLEKMPNINIPDSIHPFRMFYGSSFQN